MKLAIASRSVVAAAAMMALSGLSHATVDAAAAQALARAPVMPGISPSRLPG